MSDNKFWLSLLGIVACTVLVGLALVLAAVYYADERVERMVRAGAHPIDARCAIYGFGHNTEVSMICQQRVLQGRAATN